MPSKFPFLKSSTEPYGLLEQLGVAITLNPAEDAALAGNGPGSWFGRLLEEQDFLWLLQEADGSEVERVEDRNRLAESYLSQDFRYTAFDWDLLFLELADNQGVLRGKVDLKGRSNLSGSELKHEGEHTFECHIVKRGDKWRAQRIVITRQAQRRDPPRSLSEVI